MLGEESLEIEILVWNRPDYLKWDVSLERSLSSAVFSLEELSLVEGTEGFVVVLSDCFRKVLAKGERSNLVQKIIIGKQN